jgi:PAS domain-containing protein
MRAHRSGNRAPDGRDAGVGAAGRTRITMQLPSIRFVSVLLAAVALSAATREARAILTKVSEVNFLSGPGRGVILIKLASDADRVLGFIASTGDRDLLTVETSRGAEQTISTTKYEVTGTGQENWLEQRWYPVRDPHGRVEGVLEIAHDITDRKLLEREVAECHRSLDARRNAQ